MACWICNSQGVSRSSEYRNTGRYASPIFSGLEIVECPLCRCSWVSSSPSIEQLAYYYADSNQYSAGRMGYVDEGRWPIWDSRAISLLTLARLFARFNPGDRFVDLGPGNGSALSLANLLLPRPVRACIEFNVKSIQFFRSKIPDLIVTQSIEELMRIWGKEAISMVYSAHCLEHFRPVDVPAQLSQIYDALRFGGCLALEVPFAPPARVKATSKHTPHLIFFTPEGVRQLLQNAGFSVQLCIVTLGRTPNSARFIAKNYPPPPRDVDHRISDRVATLNSADFIALDAEASAQKGGSGVIKCIATKG